MQVNIPYMEHMGQVEGAVNNSTTLSARRVLRKSGACFGMLVQFKRRETILRTEFKSRPEFVTLQTWTKIHALYHSIFSWYLQNVLKSNKPSPTQAPLMRSSWKNNALMGRFWGFAELPWVPDWVPWVPDRADPSTDRGLRDLEELRDPCFWEDPADPADLEDLEDGLRAFDGFFPSKSEVSFGSLSKLWSKEANFSCSSSKASLVVFWPSAESL